MIKVYFKEEIDDSKIVKFYYADMAELREDYLVLTAIDEDENGAIVPLEVVGVFHADCVLGWEKEP